MSIKINKNVCIGCGTCSAVCPSNFKMGDDNKAEVVSQDTSDCVQNAVESCPVQAISVS